jgi:hypothetical protein
MGQRIGVFMKKVTKTGKIVAKTIIKSIKLASAVVMLGAAITFFITKGVFLSLDESETDEKERK